MKENKSAISAETPVTSPAQKALRTAKWARTMTKWLVTHSTKGGVKWQVVSFNGKRGQESAGIVDMIAIRKNHAAAPQHEHCGDLFEIVLLQVKGGTAKFPSQLDVARMVRVKKHHRADKAVLVEWKRGETLSCYVLPDMTAPVPASEIFGKGPSASRLAKQSLAASKAT